MPDSSDPLRGFARRTRDLVRRLARACTTISRRRIPRIAAQAVELRRLGYPNSLIAGCTGVTDKTVAKAIRWLLGQRSAGTV